jgi:hypothetical protein
MKVLRYVVEVYGRPAENTTRTWVATLDGQLCVTSNPRGAMQFDTKAEAEAAAEQYAADHGDEISNVRIASTLEARRYLTPNAPFNPRGPIRRLES